MLNINEIFNFGYKAFNFLLKHLRANNFEGKYLLIETGVNNNKRFNMFFYLENKNESEENLEFDNRLFFKSKNQVIELNNVRIFREIKIPSKSFGRICYLQSPCNLFSFTKEILEEIVENTGKDSVFYIKTLKGKKFKFKSFDKKLKANYYQRKFYNIFQNYKFHENKEDNKICFIEDKPFNPYKLIHNDLNSFCNEILINHLKN